MNKESGTYRQESDKNVLLWQRYGTYRQNDNKKVLLKQSNGTYRRKGDKKSYYDIYKGHNKQFFSYMS